MLVANLDGERILAFDAERGPNYLCPECDADLILKKGDKVIHHFAHHPGSDCGWGTGETMAHLKAKLDFMHEMRRRGIKVDVEVPILLPTGNRRADVLVELLSGEKIAFEIQCTPISVDELEERTRSYIEAGIAVAWLPSISLNHHRVVPDSEGKSFHLNFPFNSFLAWVEQYSRPDFWLLDQDREALWLARSACLGSEFASSPLSALSDVDAACGSENDLLHRIGETFSEDIKAGLRSLELRGPYNLRQLDVDSRRLTYPHLDSDYPLLEHGRLARLHVMGSNTIPARVWDQQAEYRQRQVEKEKERERLRAEEERREEEKEREWVQLLAEQERRDEESREYWRVEKERRDEEEEKERKRLLAEKVQREEESRKFLQAHAKRSESERRDYAREILRPQEGWRQASNGNYHSNIKTKFTKYHVLIFFKDGEWGGRVADKGTSKGYWLKHSANPSWVKDEVNNVIEKYEDDWITFK